MSKQVGEDNLKQLQELAGKVQEQWQWVNEAASPAITALKELQATEEDNWLRVRVREMRERCEESVGSVTSVISSGREKVEDVLNTGSSHLDITKQRALDLRRENPALVVAGVTFLAVAPAYRSGIRPLVRNLVVGGGAAAFFLYPEFIARTAPYVERASDTVSKHASQQAEKLGLIKSHPPE